MNIAAVIGMLMAGFPTRLRWLVGIFCCSIAGGTWLLAAEFGMPSPVLALEKCFALDIWLAWSLFAYGSRALLGDTRTLRIPGLARTWRATMLLFGLLSVLLPAIVFGLLLDGMADSLRLFVCAAAIGMLLELMMAFPRVAGCCILAFCFATDWLKNHPSSAAFARTLQEHSMLSGLMTPWALSAILCGLAYGRWRRVILHADGKAPTFLETVGGSKDGRIGDAKNAYRESRIAGAGRNWRVFAMRYWLGAPIAPMRWQTLVLNSCGFLLLTGFFMWRSQLAVAPLMMALGLGLALLVGYTRQFGRRYLKQGGEMVELAVLPGWGDRTTTQRTLLVAVFRPLATWWIGAFALIQTLGLIYCVNTISQWSLTCTLVIAGSSAAVYCLKILAHRPSAFLLDAYFLCLAIVLLHLSLFSCLGFNWIDPRTWLVLTAIHCGAMAVLARSAYAEFRRLPHPFLTEFHSGPRGQVRPNGGPHGAIVVVLFLLLMVAAALLIAAYQYQHGDQAQDAERAAEARRLSGRIVPGPTYRSALASGGQGPEMVVLQTGAFEMGSPDYERDHDPVEGPVHIVHIHSFALGKTALTRGEFARFVAATGYLSDAEKNTAVPLDRFKAVGCFAFRGGTSFGWKAGTGWRDPGFNQDDSHPVVCLSWNDAQAYAQWLSRETGKHYRLPSESEMEYAIRAGSSAPYPWGVDPEQACQYGNVGDAMAKAHFPAGHTAACSDGFEFTSPAGHFRANAFGLLDTVGNAVTWTQDCGASSYANAPADGSAQQAVGCDNRVLRGSSWSYEPPGFRSAPRRWNPPSVRDNGTGLRLAQDL